jgi:hypothetical protein
MLQKRKVFSLDLFEIFIIYEVFGRLKVLGNVFYLQRSGE